MVKKRATPADARLDPVDRAIIEQLQHDGRMPFTKIGGAVGLSEAAAAERLRAQWPIEDKARLADAVVVTEGSMEATLDQSARLARWIRGPSSPS